MATNHVYRDRPIQIDEATTVRRQITFGLGTDEDKTFTLRKAAGAFAAGTGTFATIAVGVAEVTLAAGDIDTEGELVLCLEGATDTEYVHGLLVVAHDPFADLDALYQRFLGKSISDTSDNTIDVRNAADSTTLVTLTKSTAGTQTTWAPD